MDAFESTGAADLHHLFLRYLSLGQLECARMVYLTSAQDRAKFDKSLLLILCGYRPQDWVYTARCPSYAHLAWWCAKLRFGDGQEMSYTALLPRFSLAAAALLREAGFQMQELESFARPSMRARALASYLLEDETRLALLLACPRTKLASLVWQDLEDLCADEQALGRVLARALEELVVVENRVLDAVHLFANCHRLHSTIACPENLARAIAGEEDQVQIARVLLEQGCFSAEMHASLFRHRQPKVGNNNNTLHAFLLNALRAPRTRKVEWFVHLVENPFVVRDAPQILKVLYVLTSVGESDFIKAAAAVPLVQTTGSNDLAMAAQEYVNRLAFASICSRVHALFGIKSAGTEVSLIHPLLLLKPGTSGASVSSKEVLNMLAPALSMDAKTWLKRDERTQVLQLSLSCWLAEETKSACLNLDSFSPQELIWAFRIAAQNGELERFVHSMSTHSNSKLREELELRAKVANLVQGEHGYDDGILEWSTGQLVSVCFANLEWELAQRILQLDAARDSPLLREARVLHAMEEGEIDFRFTPMELQDLEFYRNMHQGNEAVSHPNVANEVIHLVESNLESSPEEFIARCEGKDVCQILVDYYSIAKVRRKDAAAFHNMARRLLSKLPPFPSAEATRAFQVLIGLASDSRLDELLREDDEAAMSRSPRLSEYSLDEGDGVDERLERAARCLGFELEDGGLFCSFTDDGEDAYIDEMGAMEALGGLDVEVAQEFCVALALHLLRGQVNGKCKGGGGAQAYERWMLQQVMERLDAKFSFASLMSREDAALLWM